MEAVPVATYFEDTYVGRPRRYGLCSALFPPEVWSVRESTLEDMPRTNNSFEAWHRGFQVSFLRLGKWVLRTSYTYMSGWLLHNNETRHAYIMLITTLTNEDRSESMICCLHRNMGSKLSFLGLCILKLLWRGKLY